MRILIVDDHTLVRRGLAFILQDEFEGAEMCEAGDAEEAIAILEEAPVDVALIDVRLPGVDGIELLTTVKERWPETPAIMLTTFDNAGYARASLAEGAAGYLLKDANTTELVQAIKVAMSGGGSVLSDKVIQNLFDDLNASKAAPEAPSLTRREREILQLLVEGNSNRDISTHLYLSEKTVKAHLAAVFRKLGSTNRTQAAMTALNMGLVSAPTETAPAPKT